MSEEYEIQERLEISGQAQPGGTFEIIAITAGEGNGWTFAADVLKESLDLWGGVETFIDHNYSWFAGRSVRDLAGVCSSPRWDGEANGIKLKLRPMGPSGALLAELGSQLLADETEKPRVGFSADVVFKAKGREVKQILRVMSLDLVFNPARGGAFLRALNSIQGVPPTNTQGVNVMTDQQEVQEGRFVNRPNEQATLTGDLEAARRILDQQAEQTRRTKEFEEAQQVRLQMCGYLLESALNASKLPGPMQENLRTRFADRVFDATELTAAIDEGRKLVSDLTGGATVQGLGRVHGVFDSSDQLQAAVDDLLDAPRDKGAEGVKAARLSGVKELYMLLTGDRDLHGGFHVENVQLATTADFTGLVKNAMNKIVANQWAALGASGYDWWMKVTAQEHFDTLNTITGILVGTVGTLPSVAEGAAYQPLEIGDSPETADFTKYGGYIPLTLELIDRDDTRKLRIYPRELAKSGMRLISQLVSAVFTSNSGVGPTMADTGALFNATAVTTAGGHANLLTTALASAAWVAVKNAVYSQKMLIKNAAGLYGTGAAMALDPRYMLVPKALELTAQQILYDTFNVSASVIGDNLLKGKLGDVVVVPEWTDTTDWAAVVDPQLVPGIVVGERFGLMPEIFIAGSELSPAVFTNDEHRLKVRHFVAVLVQDFRPLHKSNVAG